MGSRGGERRAPFSEATYFLLGYGLAGAVAAGLGYWAFCVAFFCSAQTIWHDCFVASEEKEGDGRALIWASGSSFVAFLGLVLLFPLGTTSGFLRLGCALGFSRALADFYLARRAKFRKACFRPAWPTCWAEMRRFVAYANEALLIQGFFLWVACRQGTGALGAVALVLSLFRPLEVLVQGDARYLLGRWSDSPMHPSYWSDAKSEIAFRMKGLALICAAAVLFGRPFGQWLYRISFQPKVFVVASGYFLSVAAVIYLRNLSLAFGKFPPLTWLVLLGGAANALLGEFVDGSVEIAFMGQTVILIVFALFLWAAARQLPLFTGQTRSL